MSPPAAAESVVSPGPAAAGPGGVGWSSRLAWLGARVGWPSPLTWLAGGWTLGFLLQQTGLVGRPAWWTLVALGIGGLWWSCWRPGWIPRWICWLSLLVGMGGYWTQWREPGNRPGIGQIISRTGEPLQLLRVRGLVVSRNRPRPAEAQNLLEAFRFAEPQLEFVVQVDSYQVGSQWVATSGRLDCKLEQPLDPETPGSLGAGSSPAARVLDLAVGQRVEVLGIASLPALPKNPGQFDQRRSLWLSGMEGELKLGDPEQLQVLEARPAWTTAGYQLRDYFKQLLQRHLPERQYPMAAAVLLGDRSMLGSQLRQQYAATGTVHVLAISGLHLGILAGAVLWLARWSVVPQRPLLWLTIGLVLFYAWLVEFRPPIVRAAVLTTAMCVASLIGRRAFSINSLALALCVVFVLEPHQIAEPGTQLSFLAVTAIVVFLHQQAKRVPDPLEELRESQASPVRRHGTTWLRSVGRIYLCGAVVSLACLPLVVHHFHLLAWMGFLINPLVIVPMSLALLSGFGLLITAPFSPFLGHCFGWMCSQSLTAMHGIVDCAYQVPGSYLWVTSPGGVWIVAWYLGCGVIVWLSLGRFSWRPGFRRGVIVGGLLFWVAAYLWPMPRFPDRIEREGSGRGPLTVTFIDVGHGGAALLRTPAGRVILFDAGSFPSARAAGNRIGGVLMAHGIQRIDMLCISHADLDHYNGVPELLRRFAIREILVPEGLREDPSPYVQFLTEALTASAAQIRSVAAEPGSLLWEEPDLQIEVISPPPGGFPDGDNSNSLVLEIRYGQSRLLLTADLEGRGLQELLRRPSAAFTVVQVPHHGSRQSRPREMAEWSRPSLAVISGLQRRVSQETRQAWESVAADAPITDQEGAILVNLFPDGTQVWRSYLRQPWSIR